MTKYINPHIFLSLFLILLIPFLWNYPETITWSLGSKHVTLAHWHNYLLISGAILLVMAGSFLLSKIWGVFNPILLSMFFIINPVFMGFLSTKKIDLFLAILFALLSFSLLYKKPRSFLLTTLLLIGLKALSIPVNGYLLLVLLTLIFLLSHYKNFGIIKSIILFGVALIPTSLHLRTFIKSLVYIQGLSPFPTENLTYPHHLLSATHQKLLGDYFLTGNGALALRFLFIALFIFIITKKGYARLFSLALLLLMIFFMPSNNTLIIKNTVIALNNLHLPLIQLPREYFFLLLYGSLAFLLLQKDNLPFTISPLLKKPLHVATILFILLVLTPIFLFSNILL